MRWITLLAVGLINASALAAANSIDAKSLCMKSSGEAVENAWKFSETGFVGTFVRLDNPGELKVTVNYSAKRSDAKVDVVVADEKAGTELKAGDGSFQTTFQLPLGTYFVRIQFVEGNEPADSSFLMKKVSIDGGSILNESSDANALAASNSYIENFRRGKFTVKLPGASAATSVHATLTRHAFKFGTAVGGFDKNELFIDNPLPDSNAAKYQATIKREFNAMVPGNAGKWAYDEATKDVVTMDYIDALVAFARKNDLTMRMHTLLWNTGQQPKWTIDLVDAAASGDAIAKAELRKRITKRIQYFVRDRVQNYWAIDILNEPYHQQKYLDIFGIDGVAAIYKEAGDALVSAGATTHLCVNEYNILQWSQQYPFKDQYLADPYANWYRAFTEKLIHAGAPIGGIGVQYYVDLKPGISQPHNPTCAFGALQNLSTLGLPLTLTEFGVQTRGDLSKAPDAEEQTLRLVFGNAQMDGFIQWGFWTPELWEKATGGAFYDKDWNPTPVYERWHKVMAEWTTDVEVPVKDGSIEFTGFYGDYKLTAGDKTMSVTTKRGTREFSAAMQ